MLDDPRLLLLRALDPLYPREPPPNASRFPPPLRERSRLPIRSGPPPSDRLPAPAPAARLLTPCASGAVTGKVSALSANLLARTLLAIGKRVAPRRSAKSAPPWRGPYTARATAMLRIVLPITAIAAGW